MERKIGEIFNYQDNWYQCIENTGYGCIICHFNTHNNICCNNVLSVIIVSAILIKLKWNDKCYYWGFIMGFIPCSP